MDYKIDYPEKNTAVISFTDDPEQWKADLEAAKAQIPSATDDEAKNLAINIAASRVFNEVAGKEHLKLATQPTLVSEPAENGGETITLTCLLVPEVTLAKYTGMDLVKEEAEVTDDEVMSEVIRRINAQKIWHQLPEDAAAKDGDEVVIDFVGEKDGVPFEGGSAQSYPLVLGSGSFIPGFEEQLIGIKAGETRDVNVTFPEDYFEPSLAGAPVVFHVKCIKVSEPVKAELNDNFVAEMKLDGVKTVDELLERTKADLLAVKEEEVQNALAMKILDKIAKESSADIPEEMIANQVAQTKAQYEQNLQQYGMSFEDFLKASKQTAEEFDQRLYPQAEAEIKNALVLEAIAEKEQITASSEELAQEYDLLSRVYGFPAEQLKMLIPEASVSYQITQRKTLDFLTKNNTK